MIYDDFTLDERKPYLRYTEIKELVDQASIPFIGPPINVVDSMVVQKRKFSFLTPKNETPAHPGTVFQKYYIVNKMQVSDMAKKLHCTRQALYNLVSEKSSLSPKMAIKIAIETRTSPYYWLSLQNEWDIYTVEQKF